MTDVPNLPNFTRFFNGFREDPSSITSEGDMRSAFFAAYRETQCEHLNLFQPGDRQATQGRARIGLSKFRNSLPAWFPHHGSRPGHQRRND